MSVSDRFSPSALGNVFTRFPSPYWSAPQALLYLGDVRVCLRGLLTRSVHCVVTSPPYWGLRAYLEEQHPLKGLEVGAEPSADGYVQTIVEVFREIWRVLRDDGVAWLNLGDTYEGGDLVGIPWRVALALKADGWVLRSAVPWIKRSAMPEQCRSRPSKATEDVFMLAKSTSHYFDMAAVEVAGSGKTGGSKFGRNGTAKYRSYDRPDYEVRAWRSGDLWLSEEGIEGTEAPASNSNHGIHDATFTPRLITPMILSSTSAHGCCTECDDPYLRCGDMWRKTCGCRSADASPAIVLDPFVGSGTTVATALTLGRHGVGIDLSETYLREHAIPRIEAALRGEKVTRKVVTRAIPIDVPPPPQRLD